MKKYISFDKDKKVLPILLGCLGAAAAAALFVFRMNRVAVLSAAYMIVVSVILLLGVVCRRRVYLYPLAGLGVSGFGIVLYYILFGADAGFGAFFDTNTPGWNTADHPLCTQAGNLLTRIGGNLLLALPWLVVAGLIVLLAVRAKKGKHPHRVTAFLLSAALTCSTVFYLLTMNLRSDPNTQRLWEGHDNYLKGVDRHKSDSPNVLFILMDDMGWGDISAHGAIFDTPNFDRIGEEGLSFDNFYSSYSVCSPARFAALTGRYPFRGYADNVMYPSVNSFSPFAATRLNNAFEMGANCDGMLGDEITIAEVLQSAGYDTACFGKWHLGDYGEYLPTNQGFDYFYGSHYVNDMNPFCHLREENGVAEVVHTSQELTDQSKATEWINEEMFSWLDNQMAASDDPFFLYYASPWPHAPVYAGDDFDGKTGMGTYADCITEVDYYLGLLFDKLEKAGELDDTIILFTSDNGPALEGSTGLLRGGKYLAYEGGQKVPFAIRWGNGKLWEPGSVRSESATLVDVFPTLIDLCGIRGQNGEDSYLPADRVLDGVSMLPTLQRDEVIHTPDKPILYMKREKLKAIQYTVSTGELLSGAEYTGYDYKVLQENENIDFKYYQSIQNDNSAFFDKFRKNWLHILSDDIGENYNRSSVYPTVAKAMSDKMDEITDDLHRNRRGTR